MGTVDVVVSPDVVEVSAEVVDVGVEAGDVVLAPGSPPQAAASTIKPISIEPSFTTPEATPSVAGQTVLVPADQSEKRAA